MKKILVCIALFLFAVPVCAETIILKSGNKLETSEYWEENGKVYFIKYGQTIGILKSSVLRIEGGEAQKDGKSEIYEISDKDKNTSLEELDAEYQMLAREKTALLGKKDGMGRKNWNLEIEALRKKAIYFAKKTGYYYDTLSNK